MVTIDERIMGGVPCMAGTRIPVETIQGMTKIGFTVPEIAAAYPPLTVDDVQEALRYQ